MVNSSWWRREGCVGSCWKGLEELGRDGISAAPPMTKKNKLFPCLLIPYSSHAGVVSSLTHLTAHQIPRHICMTAICERLSVTPCTQRWEEGVRQSTAFTYSSGLVSVCFPPSLIKQPRHVWHHRNHGYEGGGRSRHIYLTLKVTLSHYFTSLFTCVSFIYFE